MYHLERSHYNVWRMWRAQTNLNTCGGLWNWLACQSRRFAASRGSPARKDLATFLPSIKIHMNNIRHFKLVLKRSENRHLPERPRLLLLFVAVDSIVGDGMWDSTAFHWWRAKSLGLTKIFVSLILMFPFVFFIPVIFLSSLTNEKSSLQNWTRLFQSCARWSIIMSILRAAFQCHQCESERTVQHLYPWIPTYVPGIT